MPCKDDDGFILYESRAICWYIATKYADQGTKLIPTDSLESNALFEQAVSIEQNNFHQYVKGAAFEMVYKPLVFHEIVELLLSMDIDDRKFLGETPDKAVFDKHIATLSAKLDAYNIILGKQKYLAGEVNPILFSIHGFMLNNLSGERRISR